jgi:hypothetical protein
MAMRDRCGFVSGPLTMFVWLPMSRRGALWGVVAQHGPALLRRDANRGHPSFV